MITVHSLGDDLALNAQQVSGVKADRELPVVLSVAKGSLMNKAILVPLALLISAFAPWAITQLLMVGGAYLCYEGFEKVLHSLVLNRPGFPGECFVCELRLPEPGSRLMHNTLFPLQPEGYDPDAPSACDCCTSPPMSA